MRDKIYCCGSDHESKLRTVNILSLGMLCWRLYCFTMSLPITHLYLCVSRTQLNTWRHMPSHMTAFHCYFSVSNTFLWGNTCRPGQRTTQTVQWGHFIKTLWHHDSALVSTSPTKIFTTTRPFPFFAGCTENTTSHCGYLRSLKIPYKDNSPYIRWQSCSLLPVSFTSKL